MEIKNLKKNNIRFNIIGDISNVEDKVRQEILFSMEETKMNSGLNLNLAFNYSGRQEIVNMAKNILIDYDNNKLLSSDINDQLIKDYLYTSSIPDPDLLIRTGGEYRISNFLLWQIAYSEIYFTQTYWPSFDEDELFVAIKDYQNRERRFGKVSEQIS